MLSPDWLSLYRIAVLEPNNAKFAVKATAAKNAILERLRELESEKETNEISDERRVLGEALQNLQQLIARQHGSI